MRKTPLRPGKPPVRRTALRARNPERRAAESERCYGPHARYVRAHGCYIATKRRDQRDCWGGFEASHTENGGKGYKAPARTLADLCHGHHKEYDGGKDRFDAKYRVNMKARALDLWLRSPYNTGYGCGDCEAEGRVCNECWDTRQQEAEWLATREGG